MGKPVVHFEVIGKDPDKLQSYYSELFDWKFEDPPGDNNPTNYRVMPRDEGNGGIGGGIGGTPEGYDGHVTFYVAVPDVEASLKQAEELGGKAMMGPHNVTDSMVIALFTDPEGHTIGLVNDDM